MNISTYIESVGDEVFAGMVGCKVRTAASWRRGERSPSAKNISKIVAATKGRVGVDGCLNLEQQKAA